MSRIPTHALRLPQLAGAPAARPRPPLLARTAPPPAIDRREGPSSAAVTARLIGGSPSTACVAAESTAEARTTYGNPLAAQLAARTEGASAKAATRELPFGAHFDASTAAHLAADRQLARELADLDPHSVELVGALADAVFRSLARDPKILAAEPYGYSKAVMLALDADTREALGPKHEPARGVRLVPSAGESTPARSSGGVTAGVLALAKKVAGPVLRGLNQLLRRLSGPLRTDEHLPVRTPPLRSPIPATTTLRVYMGIRPEVDPTAVRQSGLKSNLERLSGREAAEARIAEHGAVGCVLDHLVGDYGSTPYVSTSLSLEVAASYAGPGGHVITADIPAEEGIMANDPVLWAGTALRAVGNPFGFNREVVVREIRPEWITSIDRPVGGASHPVLANLGSWLRGQLDMVIAGVRQTVGGGK